MNDTKLSKLLSKKRELEENQNYITLPLIYAKIQEVIQSYDEEIKKYIKTLEIPELVEKNYKILVNHFTNLISKYTRRLRLLNEEKLQSAIVQELIDNEKLIIIENKEGYEKALNNIQNIYKNRTFFINPTDYHWHTDNLPELIKQGHCYYDF